MSKRQFQNSDRALAAVTAAVAWMGLFLTFWQTVVYSFRHGGTIVDALTGYLGYLTILSNLFIAVAFTLPLTFGRTRFAQRFTSGFVRGSATTVLLVVGISYHLLLRPRVPPQGWFWVADTTLHYVVPALALIHWILFPPTEKMHFGAPVKWMIVPALYLPYILLRGALLGSYPYYFMDVNKLGHARVIGTSMGFWVVFLILGGIMNAIARVRVYRLGSRLGSPN